MAANAQDAEKKKFLTPVATPKKGSILTAVTEDRDDETPPTDRDADTGDHNADHDRVAAAKPKVRDTGDDDQGSAKVAGNGDAGTSDTALQKSMRKFFRRDNNGDSSPDDTEAQTKTLRKQQKAQQQRQQHLSASQPSPQPTPPPKRKKFLGLF